mmetsp:Transcript_1852/g.2090  ORF Transcript_1852/g.2090 Transcript_1852/m.2090 type:complete len:80 (+) Transcript_1852:198-437(+)
MVYEKARQNILYGLIGMPKVIPKEPCSGGTKRFSSMSMGFQSVRILYSPSNTSVWKCRERMCCEFLCVSDCLMVDQKVE